ncbi:MAG: hypothetical protein QG578_1581 [Thermodesulfobacteriota bacterium]|nr:hypothetical protein [Thermodesulfobacteriota bacterium]
MLLCFAGGNFQKSVQRAKADEAGNSKYERYCHQNNADQTGYFPGEIKNRYNQCQRQSYDPVNVTHILFHPTPPFKNPLGIMILFYFHAG